MNPERDLLRLLAAMPFLDRLEMVALSGWSRGAVYAAVAALDAEGLTRSLPHASASIPRTRRSFLTTAGLRRLAAEDGTGLPELLRSLPVSAHSRRLLLERLDAVATIYRLASAIAALHHPIRFRWYRAMPMDAAIALPDGRTVAVLRQGHTADRTAFAKRLWRLREGPRPGAYLLLAPDEVRLRHARRLMAGAPAIAFHALEREAVSAGPDTRVWRTASGSPLHGLDEVLAHASTRCAWPREKVPARSSLPPHLAERDTRDAPGWLLPALLGPGLKRALDLISDWPWIAPGDLAGLLGVSARRASQVVASLEDADLVTGAAGRGLALSDRGLALLARRDRAAVGLARRRWSAAPLDPDRPLSWRNVTGRHSRQLLRNLEHTAAVHGFLADLSRQSRDTGWEVVQLDPPHRASRYFRHRRVLRSVHADAFGILCRADESRAFFLEWERRAVRPVTMAARLAPYLRYYASHRPTDDHGFQPAILVVFDDELAAEHFVRVAREEILRTGVTLPLEVSHRSAIAARGPLQQEAWRRVPDGRQRV